MKKYLYYLAAILIFILTMIVLNGGAAGMIYMLYILGMLLNPENGAYQVNIFLTDNLNLFSCLAYLITGAVFIPWYYLAVAEKKGFSAFISLQTNRLSTAGFVWTGVLAYALQHAVTVIIFLFAVLVPDIFAGYTELVETAGITSYSVSWFFSVVILPPVVEEAVFRGLIIHYLKKGGAGFWAANIIQAALFGIYHGNLIQGAYAFCIGIVLGYLALHYDSLVIPVVMHALFNTFGTIGTELESGILPEYMQGLLVLVCIPLAALAITMIRFRVGERKNSEIKGKRDVL